MTDESIDVLVVGAGIAGLACARELHRRNYAVAVLDKGRSVGGRCSTWRAPNDLRLDYGVTFFHGRDADFLSALAAVPGGIDGWPQRIVGRGDPCQPRGLRPEEQRLAFADGVSSFPKRLAVDLDVRNGTRVTRISAMDRVLRVEHNDGAILAETLVLALPCEQTRDLAQPLAENEPEIAGVCRLLDMLPTVPCLTLLATYDHEPPEWDLRLPEASRAIQLIANESSKRPERPGCGLVIQARAAWSASHLDRSPESWAGELLREAGALVGDWVTAPRWSRPHRWRYARTDLASELKGPIVLPAGQAQLGLAGELFSRGAGVEAAFLSGRALARRLIGENND